MADSLAEFAHKVDLVKNGLSGSQLRTITTKVGGKAKTAIPPDISPAGLRNWGKGKSRGKSITARYDVQSDHEVSVMPKPPALVALLEKGSYKAGTSWKAPKRRGSRRRTRGTIASYTHAHVPARESWSKAVRKNEPHVPKWIDDEVQALLRKVF